ncbi:hypothetical protein D9M69_664010 [compost metagenome]
MFDTQELQSLECAYALADARQHAKQEATAMLSARQQFRCVAKPKSPFGKFGAVNGAIYRVLEFRRLMIE